MKVLSAVAFFLAIVQALLVLTTGITLINKGVGGIVGIGPFTMKNVNIRVNGLQTDVTTPEYHRIKIHNGEIQRRNKNILPIEIGEFSLSNVNIEVNSTTPRRQSIKTLSPNTQSLDKPFSNSNLVSRLSRMLISLP